MNEPPNPYNRLFVLDLRGLKTTRYNRIEMSRLAFGKAPHENTIPTRELDPGLPVKHLAADDSRTRMHAAGFCIYCGALEYEPGQNQELGEEHIVPESLGGRLTIERASCKACEETINLYETNLANNLFWDSRKKLGIKGKKRKRSNADKFFICTTTNGIESRVEIGIGESPAYLSFPIFGSPHSSNVPSNLPFRIDAFWTYQFEDSREIVANKTTMIRGPLVDALKFCQLLAKIAYGFLVGTLGCNFDRRSGKTYIGEYEVIILSLILNRPAHSDNFPSPTPLFYNFGSVHYNKTPFKLHELIPTTFVLNETLYLAVIVRLFSNLGSPSHLVIVGKHPSAEPPSPNPLA